MKKGNPVVRLHVFCFQTDAGIAAAVWLQMQRLGIFYSWSDLSIAREEGIIDGPPWDGLRRGKLMVLLVWARWEGESEQLFPDLFQLRENTPVMRGSDEEAMKHLEGKDRGEPAPCRDGNPCRFHWLDGPQALKPVTGT